MWPVPPLQAGIEVPVATSLRAAGEAAAGRQLPILLVFSAFECPYCETLEEEFLRPMLISGEYTDKIIIRKLLLDQGAYVTDFSGNVVAVDSLASRYGVFVTPTLLFLDTRGNELAERMIGINTLEMYGGYLDECIDTALFTFRHPQADTRGHGCLPVGGRR